VPGPTGILIGILVEMHGAGVNPVDWKVPWTGQLTRTRSASCHTTGKLVLTP
jgi:hypothetical protein